MCSGLDGRRGAREREGGRTLHLGRRRVARRAPKRGRDPARVLDLDPLRVGVAQVDDAHQGVALVLLGVGRALEPLEDDGVDARGRAALAVRERRAQGRRGREDGRQLLGGCGVEAKVEQLGRVALRRAVGGARARARAAALALLVEDGARRRDGGRGVDLDDVAPDVVAAEEDLVEERLVPQVVVALCVAVDRVWAGLVVLADELDLLLEVGLADEARLAAGL